MTAVPSHAGVVGDPELRDAFEAIERWKELDMTMTRRRCTLAALWAVTILALCVWGQSESFAQSDTAAAPSSDDQYRCGCPAKRVRPLETEWMISALRVG